MCGRRRVEGVATARRQLECDTVILALGMRPNAGLAQRAGVEVGGAAQALCAWAALIHQAMQGVTFSPLSP